MDAGILHIQIHLSEVRSGDDIQKNLHGTWPEPKISCTQVLCLKLRLQGSCHNKQLHMATAQLLIQSPLFYPQPIRTLPE